MRLLNAYDRLVRRGLTLAGAKSHHRMVSGRRLHYLEWEGHGPGPALVLIHGLGASASSFAPIIPGLRRGWKRVYAIDLPGHGFTRIDPANDLLDVRGQGEVAYAFLCDVVREPAALVGNSMGGILALGIAVEKTADVRAVGLLAPAGAPLSNAELTELRSHFAPKSRRDAMKFVRRLTHRPMLPAALIAKDIQELLHAPATQHILKQTFPEQRLDENMVRKLAIPVLLVWGASERILPARGLEYFRQHLPPHAHIEVLQRCGHMPQVERPRRTLQLLNELGREAARA